MLITYLLMAATFESWVYPFVVIVTVPIGAVGGFIGLWLLNLWVLQPLDVLTMLGFIMLVGTVVNNPILIVEQSLVHWHEDGLPIGEAVVEQDVPAGCTAVGVPARLTNCPEPEQSWM